MWRCASCNLQITYTISDVGKGPVCPVCQRPAGRVGGEPVPDRVPATTGIVVVVDASYIGGLAGLAAVADGHDEIVATVEVARSAGHGEQLAISRAIERVRVLGWKRGTILSDCQPAVAVVKRVSPSVLPDGWALRWVRRDRVALAHRVAARELRLYRARVVR